MGGCPVGGWPVARVYSPFLLVRIPDLENKDVLVQCAGVAVLYDQW